MKNIKNITKAGLSVAKNEGNIALLKRSVRFAQKRIFPKSQLKKVKDILFINGCSLPHPTRYRVDHQMEQLKAAGMSSDVVFYENLSMSMLKYYRGFVFFRCPITPTIHDFIGQAKYYNKVCIFDIDDLVVDTRYTNKVKYVKEMKDADKQIYDDGVNRMRATLKLCDSAITTTEALKNKLKQYTPKVVINRNVASDEMAYLSREAQKKVLSQRQADRIVIGYFSGSITHNEDFEMIRSDIERIFDTHSNVYMKVVGILDVPKQLQAYKDRIITVPFMDWRQMSDEVALCDIIIAPLVSTVFNEAKSENKWLEAALVGVPTVASNLGAFKEVINDRETGFLANKNQWFDILNELICRPDLRERVGKVAQTAVYQNHTTVGNASNFAQIIRDCLKRNIAFFLPSTDISGGVNVVLQHATILREAGWDVTLVDTIDIRAKKKAKRKYAYREDIPGYNIISFHDTSVAAFFDTVVATLWTTLRFVKQFPNTINRLYFVQGYETDFYSHGAGNVRFEANSTYIDNTGVRYITMSLWCQKWLKERYSKTAKLAANGIDLDIYPYVERQFNKKHINILIEGDSRDEYKNTDEAFRIVERLDPNV
ncbi:glycosyltransferase, partial [Candidatus Saccharibacteria bacterium]|nr:glycosyltransferase [Candidatus Saccharibacteria bacterium]